MTFGPPWLLLSPVKAAWQLGMRLGVIPEMSIRRRESQGHQALRVREATLALTGARKVHESQFERRLHAGARAIGPHVVVESRERGEDAFHELPGGHVVDRPPFP
jgi:hypothetical protein